MKYMNQVSLLVAAVALLLAGCATAHIDPPSDLEQVNHALNRRVARVDLSDRSYARAYEVHVSLDSTEWVGFNVRNEFRVATTDVQRISVQRGSRLQNVLLGLGIGFVGGLAASTALAFAIEPKREGEFGGLASIVIMTRGTLGGTILGILFGATAPIPRPDVVYEAPLSRYLHDK